MKNIPTFTQFFIRISLCLLTAIYSGCTPAETPIGGGGSGSGGNSESGSNDEGGGNNPSNNPPGTVMLMAPDSESWDYSANECLSPTFMWLCSPDPDGDPVSCQVYLSADNASWTAYGPYANDGSNNQTVLPVNLQQSTSYHWFVKASDGKGGETFSDTLEFATGLSHPDRGLSIYMRSSKPKPCVLIFTGEGYVAEDYTYGGKFDSDINEGIENLFSIEPYKTYKEYFTVYKVAAHSEERGISIGNTDRNTVFNVVQEDQNNTYLSCNEETVFSYVSNVPGVDAGGFSDPLLAKSLVVVVCNQSTYAGTTRMYNNGTAIALCPVFKPLPYPTLDFAGIILHEAGGHGWGKFEDEYVYTDGPITQQAKETLLEWQGYGQSLNVDFTNDLTLIRWKDLINRTGYEAVGAYEGAALYSKGVWRAESINCMVNNIPYYNAYCRYLIVKRILQVSEEYTTEAACLTTFLANNKDQTYTPTKGGNHKEETFVPLAPPVRTVVRFQE